MSISPHKVLIVDAAYTPHHWASVEDSIVLLYKNLVSHSVGDESVYNGGVNRRTFERSHIDVGEILFLKEALRYDSRIPPLTNQNLFARDLCICAYCARRFHESKLSRDHVHPVSKGGKNIWTNCVTACKSCNHLKDDNFLHEAVDVDGNKMELVYVPYTPSHVERLILQNRKILASQMEFLRELLPEHSRLKNANSILHLS